MSIYKIDNFVSFLNLISVGTLGVYQESHSWPVNIKRYDCFKRGKVNLDIKKNRRFPSRWTLQDGNRKRDSLETSTFDHITIFKSA
jgi:hypothetical protein